MVYKHKCKGYCPVLVSIKEKASKTYLPRSDTNQVIWHPFFVFIYWSNMFLADKIFPAGTILQVSNLMTSIIFNTIYHICTHAFKQGKKGIRLKTCVRQHRIWEWPNHVLWQGLCSITGGFGERRGRVYTGWSRVEGVLDREAWDLSVTGAECPGLH